MLLYKTCYMECPVFEYYVYFWSKTFTSAQRDYEKLEKIPRRTSENAYDHMGIF